jgi:alpha-beta hydrolase superfamily lysophospholipase
VASSNLHPRLPALKSNLRFPLFFAGMAFLCWTTPRLALWIVLGLNKSVEYWYGEASSIFMKRVTDTDEEFLSVHDDDVALVEVAGLGSKMAAYAQMRANPAKGIGYNAIEAASKITAPMLITVAENEDLMSNDENGKKVFELVQKAGTGCEYHVLPGIGHYGVYKGPGFDEASRLAVDWFKKHLGPKQ